MPVFKTLDASRARKTGVGSDVGTLKQYLRPRVTRPSTRRPGSSVSDRRVNR